MYYCHNYCSFTAETRNYTMANIALELFYKCKNEELGCDVNVRGKDKTAHKKKDMPFSVSSFVHFYVINIRLHISQKGLV